MPRADVVEFLEEEVDVFRPFGLGLRWTPSASFMALRPAAMASSQFPCPSSSAASSWARAATVATARLPACSA